MGAWLFGHDESIRAEALGVLSSKSCPFADLGVELLESLLSRMRLHEYREGEFLMRLGDPGDYLLVVLTGTASAFIHQGPSERRTVGSFGPGDVVGEIGLLTGEARTADVVASTPVRALRLAVADFSSVANTHPEVRMLLTNVVADRLGKATYDGLGGKDIHGYRVVQCVGRGGMGIVYEAMHVGSGETVALKMLNHRLLYQEGALQRFRREARALKSLHHESIARLYECFSAYGTEFLVMEFCEGSTLKQTLADGQPLDESVVRNIVGQLAVTLRYVHAHGWTHRDLKPSNVMVGPSGLVKLLDFGLVESEPTAVVETEASTASIACGIRGTPQYMAPEQFGRKSVDYRVDLYGLACVAYEALTGRPVVEETDLLGIIQDKLRFVLPPVGEIGPGIAADMHEFLARGLAVRPENRTVDLDRIAAWAGPVNFGVRRASTVSSPDVTTKGAGSSTA